MSISKNPLRMCFDRRLTTEEEVLARVEGEEKPAAAEPAPLRIGVERWKLWVPGTTLQVAFVDGHPLVQSRVFDKAKEWEDVVSIRFVRVEDPAKAQIRIAFNENDGSWSYVGKECLGIPKKRPTMNYGWLFPETEEEEYSRTVLHEFGHALGCIHEHQSPKAGLEWNVPAVLAAFGGPPNNWSDDDIRFNILDKYSKEQVNSTKFDCDSIMIYEIAKELLLAGGPLPANSKLSVDDIAFMKSIYPAIAPVQPAQ